MQALPLVHARIEALLNDEANKSARERSLEIIHGALGDEVAEMVLAETVPEYSPIEDALNKLGKDLHKQKMPTEVVQQVYTGKLKPDVLTLAMTLDQYEAYKSDPPKAAREIGQRIERLRRGPYPAVEHCGVIQRLCAGCRAQCTSLCSQCSEQRELLSYAVFWGRTVQIATNQC